MESDKIVELIFKEIWKAEKKHPGFPNDIIHMTAILSEETGEAQQAAIDAYYSDDRAEAEIRLVKELSQVGAVVFRILMHFDRRKYVDLKGLFE